MKSTFLPFLALGLLLGLHGPSALPGQSVPAGFQGVWRSDGYGRILQVSGNALKLYHETPFGLMPDAADSAELKAEYAQVSFPTAGVAVAGNAQDESRYRWAKIPALPAGVLNPHQVNAAQGLEMAISYLEMHYAGSAGRQIDWPARIAQARSRISASSSSAQLRQGLLAMLDGIGDAHLQVWWEAGDTMVSGPGFDSRVTVPLLEAAGAQPGPYGATAFENWRNQRVIATVDRIVASGGAGWAGGRLMWYRADGIGYLMINDMIGFSASGTLTDDLIEANLGLDAAFSHLAGVDALIVDVSLNGGGYAALARAMARRFAAESAPAYAKKPSGGSAAAEQTFAIEPLGRPGFTGPVYLVTSDVTVSGGEDFTLAMRQLPNVTHYGMTTHGSLSDMLIKPLPFGMALGLSNEIYTDPSGAVWEGRGIPPEVPLPVISAETLFMNHFDRVMSLVDQMGVDPDPVPAPAPNPGAISPGLFNLSTRGRVGAGDETLVSGLIIEGAGTRDLVVVARGPSLEALGVAGAVEDVRIRILDAQMQPVGEADSLASLSAAERANLLELGILPGDEKEAVVLLEGVPAGVWHIHVSAQDVAAGVGLVEIFDITEDRESAATLFNLSSRSRVLGGEDVLITGFIVGGESEVTVLVRGRGPSLIDHGIDTAMGDPVLQILPMGQTTPIAGNDNYADWDAEMRAVVDAAGLGLDHAEESAVLVSLEPGAYTAILDAKQSDGYGVGLIEFFLIDAD